MGALRHAIPPVSGNFFTAWLVASWVESKGNHDSTGISWGVDSWATIGKWKVGVEEGSSVVIEDLNSV